MDLLDIGTIVTALAGILLVIGTTLATAARARQLLEDDPVARHNDPLSETREQLGTVRGELAELRERIGATKTRVHQVQSGGIGSINVQAGGTLNIGDVTLPVPSAPPAPRPTDPLARYDGAVRELYSARDMAHTLTDRGDELRGQIARLRNWRLIWAVALAAVVVIEVALGVIGVGSQSPGAGFVLIFGMVALAGLIACARRLPDTRSLSRRVDREASSAVLRTERALGELEAAHRHALGVGIPADALYRPASASW